MNTDEKDPTNRLVVRFIRTITLRRVFLVLLIAIAVVVGLILYENRTTIFETGIKSIDREIRISQETANRVKIVVSTNPNINSITVYGTNLRLNSRKSLFNFDLAGQPVPSFRQAIFTSNAQDNQDMVRLINGEFICVLTDFTSSNGPACMVSLPPYFGFFSGFIVCRLRSVPTSEQRDSMKITLEELASEIYLRDVIPTVGG